jgi:hypothetical protein
VAEEPKKIERLIVPLSATGQVRGLYGPLVDKITKALGTQEITRASHVEPTGELSDEAVVWLFSAVGPYGGTPLPESFAPYPEPQGIRNRKQLPQAMWWADMLPVQGPVLGPFHNREDALAGEEVWLHAHNIPVCNPCRGVESPNAQALTPTLAMAKAMTYQELVDRGRLAQPDFTAIEQKVMEFFGERSDQANNLAQNFDWPQYGKVLDTGEWTITNDTWERTFKLQDSTSEKITYRVFHVIFEPAGALVQAYGLREGAVSGPGRR